MMSNPARSRFEVPLSNAPRPDDAASPAPALTPLVYLICDHDKRQPRVVGRKVLEPSIHLDEYVFDALIDWIEIGITTKRSTNYDAVNNRLGELRVDSVYSTGPNGELNPSGRHFRPRIQNPAPEAVPRIETVLDESFGLLEPTRINGLEVSIDIKPVSGCPRARAAMVAHLHRHHLASRTDWTDRDDDMRQVYSEPGRGMTTSYLIQAIDGEEKRSGVRVEIESDTNLEHPLVREGFCG